MSDTDLVVSADLSVFGYSELLEAATLLNQLATQDVHYLGSGITLNFNRNSGCVFLSDEDYRVAMLNSDGKIQEWFFCSYCGVEGFDGDPFWRAGRETSLQFESYEGCCSEECHKLCCDAYVSHELT